jgi:hypothetical protein
VLPLCPFNPFRIFRCSRCSSSNLTIEIVIQGVKTVFSEFPHVPIGGSETSPAAASVDGRCRGSSSRGPQPAWGDSGAGREVPLNRSVDELDRNPNTS